MEVVGGKKRKEHGGEESNNLMWLLDFKLDFFNESEASSKCTYYLTIFYTEIVSLALKTRDCKSTFSVKTVYICYVCIKVGLQ